MISLVSAEWEDHRGYCREIYTAECHAIGNSNDQEIYCSNAIGYGLRTADASAPIQPREHCALHSSYHDYIRDIYDFFIKLGFRPRAVEYVE